MILSSGMKKFYLYMAIFAIIVIFLLVPIVVPYLSRSADYSVFNNEWNGTSKFYRGYLQRSEIIDLNMDDEQFLNTIIGGIEDLSIGDFENAAIVILGPRKSFSIEEKEYLSFFVESGGTLLLADDFGSGNEILEYMDLTTRFSNDIMMDYVYEKAGAFSISYKGEGLSEYNILLNRPSTITGAPVTLYGSTLMSFIDYNENKIFDDGEPTGPFTISTLVEYGGGQIYLFSDPSIFINNMIEKMDNDEYIFSLLERITGNYQKKVYIDEGHLGSLEDIENIELIIKAPNNPIFRYLMIVFLLSILAIESQLFKIAKKGIMLILNKFKFGKEITNKVIDRKELITSLKEIHPEWQLSRMNSFFSKFR